MRTSLAKVPQFTCFLGVDQTGAATHGGARAKPLPVAWLEREGEVWRLRSRETTERAGARERKTNAPASARDRGRAALTLPSLNPAGLSVLAAQLDRADLPSSLAMMVDCVFGLPADVSRALGHSPRGAAHIWRLFRRAADRPGDARFGRAVSEAFFADLVRDSRLSFDPLPRRDCERACMANSVFLTRPFQKNVQTGTHRIWRDLGEGARAWTRIWPFDAPAPGTWLFESYPSLLWRELFGLRTRLRPALRAAATAYFRKRAKVTVDDWDFITADPERADAAVLALGGLALQLDGRLFEPFAGFDRRALPTLPLEGWITGLIPPTPRATR